MWRMMLAFSLVAGCSAETVGTGGCRSTDDCDPGQVCIDSACERVCRSDRDCPNGEVCVADVCATGVRDSGPVIISIDADGTEDTTTGHAPHHIATELYILGENFEGAAVVLDDGTTQRELDICTATDTRLDVALPSDLQPGDHTLSVVTQGGQCDAALPTLQGEAGSPDTGNDIVSKINTDATTLIDASKITAVDAATLTGMTASDFALATHAHVGEYPKIANGAVSTANAWFRDDMDGWSMSNGAGGVVDSATSPSGKAFANTDDQMAWIHGSTPIQVDPRKTYVVRGWFQNTTTSVTAGNVYLAVLLYDASGALIAGDGTWWYYAVSNFDAAAAGWYRYSMRFGWYTDRTFPAEAATMTVGAVLNYDNSSPGNRIFEVTGLQIEPIGGPDMATRQRIERYAALCAAHGSAAGSAAAVTPGDTSVTLSGDQVCNAYVGNNGRTNWTCVAVPYVYDDYYNRDPTGTYFGTDVRPTWRPCATATGPSGSGSYLWLDPRTGEGQMMACCTNS